MLHGILQTRILEWVAIPFSRGSSQARDWTQVSCIADRFFTSWSTMEVPQRCSIITELQVLKKTLESPFDCKEIQPVHHKGDQSWVFIGRTNVEAETPIPWPPHVKSWLTWKDPDAGKDWGLEEKGMIEGELVGWRHQLDGHGFGWTPGVGDG